MGRRQLRRHVARYFRKERIGARFDSPDSHELQRFETLYGATRVRPGLHQLRNRVWSVLAQVFDHRACGYAKLFRQGHPHDRRNALHHAAERFFDREGLLLRQRFGKGALDHGQRQLDHRADRRDVVARKLLQEAEQLVLQHWLWIHDRVQRLELVLGDVRHFAADVEHDPEHAPRLAERDQDTRTAAHSGAELRRHDITEGLPERDGDRDAREAAYGLASGHDAQLAVHAQQVCRQCHSRRQRQHPQPGRAALGRQRRAGPAAHHRFERGGGRLMAGKMHGLREIIPRIGRRGQVRFAAARLVRRI